MRVHALVCARVCMGMSETQTLNVFLNYFSTLLLVTFPLFHCVYGVRACMYVFACVWVHMHVCAWMLKLGIILYGLFHLIH